MPRGSAQGSFASVNGARPTNTNFYVDGFDNRNVQGGAAQVRPNIDALQEFKMEVSGYSAEYGRMAGGILNMSLRSGTNGMHGNISYFLRNDALDARGFFDADKTRLNQNQFSVTATGPVVKNKTFFMLSYELQRRDFEQTRLSRVPTPMEIGGDFSQTIGLSHLDNQLDVTDDAVLDRLRSAFSFVTGPHEGDATPTSSAEAATTPASRTTSFPCPVPTPSRSGSSANTRRRTWASGGIC